MLNLGLRSALNAASSSSLTSGLSGAGVAPKFENRQKCDDEFDSVRQQDRDPIACGDALT